MKKLLLVMAVGMVALCVSAGDAKYYICKYCGTKVVKNATPSNLHCPAHTFHQWYVVAPVGPVPWQCERCGIQVYLKERATPSNTGCPANSFHRWNKQ